MLISQTQEQPRSISKHFHITATSVSAFTPLSKSEVSKRLTCNRLLHYCLMDPIPTNLLQSITPTLTPAVTHMINALLTSSTFPTVFKAARVTPLLKKPSEPCSG